jgi:anti-sigma factor RsiW
MTHDTDNLEHLFARHLDGECSPQEEQVLRSLLRRQPELRAQLRDYARLDREIGDALRATMGRPSRVSPSSPWARIGRGVLLAAAACLAAMAWLQPRLSPNHAGANRTRQAGMASWFAPAAPEGDTIEPTPPGYERPEVRLRGTHRDWIVIPGDQPGTYLVIEVDHVRTHVIGVHRDY